MFDIDGELKKINTGYESALVENTSRTAADKALGSVFSSEMKSYLKLIGPDALVFTAPEIANKLNKFYHAPSKKLLGDYIVEKFIKEATLPNKTNLNLLKNRGINVKNIKTNIGALIEMDKIDVSQAAFSSKDLNSSSLSKTFNKIIEGKTGIKASDVYSKSRCIKSGKGKGKLDIIPPSAEDFVGLLYKTLGKGKEGDAQMAWYKKNLIDPFARGDEAITNERNALMRDFKQVKKEIVESIGGTDFKGVSPLTKKLKATIGDQVYTGEDAVRMYIWKKQGMEIPNIDKAEVDAAVAEVAKDPMLADFANKIRTINRGRPYTAPENEWVGGNIATDFLAGINTEGRAKHLEEWQANVDAVFSKENMNKLEGAFGTNYRKAIENMLKRMKTGTVSYTHLTLPTKA